VPLVFGTMFEHLLQQLASVIMGPCVRRDDTEFLSRTCAKQKNAGAEIIRSGAFVKALKLTPR